VRDILKLWDQTLVSPQPRPFILRMPPIRELTLHARSLCIHLMMGQLSVLNHTIKVGGKRPQVVGCFEYKGGSDGWAQISF